MHTHLSLDKAQAIKKHDLLISSLNLLEHFVLFGLFSFFVLPQITVLEYGIHLGTLMAPAILIIILSVKRYTNVNKLFFFFLLFCVTVTFSNLYGYNILSVPFSFRDFMELVKILQFLPYLYAVKFLKPNKFLQLAFKYFKIGSFIFIFLGLIQLFSVPFFAEFFTNLYSDVINSHGRIAILGDRIIATGSDPNVASFICIFLFAYNFFGFKAKKKFKLGLFFNSCLLFILLLFTQSRTGLLAFTFAFTLYILLIYQISLIKKLLIIISIFIILPLIIFLFNLEYIYIGFQNLLDGTNNSFLVRVSNFLFAIEKFTESPIFGWGVAKSIHPTILDTEYGQFIMRFGVIGILNLIIFYYLNLKQLFVNFTLNKKKDFLFSSYFFVIVTSLVVMITNSIFFGYQLLSIIVLCYIMDMVKHKSLVVYNMVS